MMSRKCHFGAAISKGVIEVFDAIERFLDPNTRGVLQAWIEKDVFMWRVKAMLGHPPNWRLNMLAGPRSRRSGGRQYRPCGPCLIGWRWRSRLVAAAAEDRLIAN